MLKAIPSAKDFLEQVYRASPEIEKIAQLARDFFRIIRERHLPALISWITVAKQPHWRASPQGLNEIWKRPKPP